MTSQSLEVEDAQAFDDSVAAIRRHLDDGASDELLFEVNMGGITQDVSLCFISCCAANPVAN